jgi:hypothetical protein
MIRRAEFYDALTFDLGLAELAPPRVVADNHPMNPVFFVFYAFFAVDVVMEFENATRQGRVPPRPKHSTANHTNHTNGFSEKVLSHV